MTLRADFVASLTLDQRNGIPKWLESEAGSFLPTHVRSKTRPFGWNEIQEIWIHHRDWFDMIFGDSSGRILGNSFLFGKIDWLSVDRFIRYWFPHPLFRHVFTNLNLTLGKAILVQFRLPQLLAIESASDQDRATWLKQFITNTDYWKMVREITGEGIRNHVNRFFRHLKNTVQFNQVRYQLEFQENLSCPDPSMSPHSDEFWQRTSNRWCGTSLSQNRAWTTDLTWGKRIPIGQRLSPRWDIDDPNALVRVDLRRDVSHRERGKGAYGQVDSFILVPVHEFLRRLKIPLWNWMYSQLRALSAFLFPFLPSSSSFSSSSGSATSFPAVRSSTFHLDELPRNPHVTRQGNQIVLSRLGAVCVLTSMASQSTSLPSLLSSSAEVEKMMRGTDWFHPMEFTQLVDWLLHQDSLAVKTIRSPRSELGDTRPFSGLQALVRAYQANLLRMDRIQAVERFLVQTYQIRFQTDTKQVEIKTVMEGLHLDLHEMFTVLQDPEQTSVLHRLTFVLDAFLQLGKGIHIMWNELGLVLTDVKPANAMFQLGSPGSRELLFKWVDLDCMSLKGQPDEGCRTIPDWFQVSLHLPNHPDRNKNREHSEYTSSVVNDSAYHGDIARLACVIQSLLSATKEEQEDDTMWWVDTMSETQRVETEEDIFHVQSMRDQIRQRLVRDRQRLSQLHLQPQQPPLPLATAGFIRSVADLLQTILSLREKEPADRPRIFETCLRQAEKLVVKPEMISARKHWNEDFMWAGLFSRPLSGIRLSPYLSEN